MKMAFNYYDEVIVMRVNRVISANDSMKPHVYYAGTHLVHYDPTHYSNRAKGKNVVEKGVFEKYLEKFNGQRDLMFTSSTQERKFLEQSLEHSANEELLQRLNYISGVHYSQRNKVNYLEA